MDDPRRQDVQVERFMEQAAALRFAGLDEAREQQVKAELPPSPLERWQMDSERRAGGSAKDGRVGLALTDAKLLGRMTASLRAFYRAVAESMPASALWERPGITAAIVPASPNRSVLNAVVYEQDGDLEGTLPELAAAYDQAGVNAWTVWVPPGDERTPGLLERAGHRLDAPPPAMAAEIASIDLGIAPAQWGRAVDLREVAEINERAYGYDRGDFTDALVGRPQGVYAYVARVHGRSVSCAVAVDHEGDCCITLVATESHVRGRGMASGLIGLALSEARERGCETTSLQASQAGYPVYRKLGYRDLGPMGMWERRRQPPERAG